MWKLLIGTAGCFLFVCAPPWFTGWQRRASGERQNVLTECSRALVTAGVPRAQWVTMNNESEMARALYSQLWSIDSNDDPADWLRLFDSSRHQVLCFPRWSDFILVLFFPPSFYGGVYKKLELWENISRCSSFLCLLPRLSLLSVSIILGYILSIFNIESNVSPTNLYYNCCLGPAHFSKERISSTIIAI